MSLTKEQLTRPYYKRKVVKVSTPELSMNGDAATAHVYVCSLNGRELKEMKEFGETKDAEGFEAAAAFCAFGVCDSEGNRLFELGDREHLLNWPKAALERCCHEVLAINGLNAKDEKDDPAGNSASVPT